MTEDSPETTHDRPPGPDSTPCRPSASAAAAASFLWMRMWWSVNPVNGMISSTFGMWHPMQSAVAFTGQRDAATASTRSPDVSPAGGWSAPPP